MAMDIDRTVTAAMNHLADPSLIPGCLPFNTGTYCFSRRLVKSIVKAIIEEIDANATVQPDHSPGDID